MLFTRNLYWRQSMPAMLLLALPLSLLETRLRLFRAALASCVSRFPLQRIPLCRERLLRLDLYRLFGRACQRLRCFRMHIPYRAPIAHQSKSARTLKDPRALCIVCDVRCITARCGRTSQAVRRRRRRRGNCNTWRLLPCARAVLRAFWPRPLRPSFPSPGPGRTR